MTKTLSFKELVQKVQALERQIALSRDYQHGLLEMLPIMAHSIDKSGFIIDVSNTWLKKMGYDKQAVIGRKSIDFLTAESRDYAQKTALPRFFEKGPIENVPYQFVKKDGGIIDVLLSAVPLNDENGAFLRSIAVMADVTEEKKSNDLLKSQKRLLKETQALTKIGGWELCLESGHVIWTDEVYRIYGVNPEAYNPNDTARDLKFYLPEDRPAIRRAFERAVNQGVPYDLELKAIRADGQHIWVRTNGKPRFKDGKVVRVSGNIMDITERVNLEQKIKQAMTLLESVYESLDDAVFVIDPDTRFVISCNTAAETMFGYKKEEMIGRNTRFLHVNEEKYSEFGKKVNAAFKADDLFKTEYTLKRKNGKTFFSGHTVKRHQKKTDQEIIHISIIRDISHRKKAISALKKKETVLNLKSKQLEEMNTALKVLLKQRDREKKGLEESFSESINSGILPYLEQIRKTRLNDLQTEYLNVLESNLKDITIPYQHRLSGRFLHLTPAETQVINYVKQGLRTKQISAILNVSSRTVEFHRQSIRKKLGLKDRNINLGTFLKNIS